MGRSVSRHIYSVAVCYEDVSWMGDNAFDWDDWVDEQRTKAEEAFPSMQECEEWLDDEDLAIMENDHAYIGVSEYCGCASIWLVPKGELMHSDHYELSIAWANKVIKTFNNTFGDLVRLGGFNDGTSVFRGKV